MVDRDSVDSFEDVPIDVADLNPEGYGIDGDFKPVAVFDEPGKEVRESRSRLSQIEEDDNEDIEDDDDEDGREISEQKDEEVEEEEYVELSEEEDEEEAEDDKQTEEEVGEEEKETDEELAAEEETAEEEEMAAEEDEEQSEDEHGVAEKTGLKFEEPAKGHKAPLKESTKRRMSIRKKSIAYSAQSRLRPSTDHRISGDFAAIAGNIYADTVLNLPSITTFSSGSMDFYYEEDVDEEEIIPIDREYYYNKYASLLPEKTVCRMKNNLLHKKMAEYFRKRKMEHVLKETDQLVDSQQKYDKKLDALEELKGLDNRERNSVSAELYDLRSQRDEQLSNLNTQFEDMQRREKETGTGLINTKTGKEIPEKLVERLVKRQKEKWKEVASMRLFYIKVRNKVGEKKVALRKLDCIGENLHLNDYEQLTIEHQSQTDKIEERDEELGRLRAKCHEAMQCLAHVREKTAAVQLDTEALKERYEEVDMDFAECRESLSYYKLERDKYRLETDKIAENSGLLNKPKLLEDMEKSLKEVNEQNAHLSFLKAEHERLKEAMQAIKTNISLLPEKVEMLKAPPVKERKSRIYKGRPTLVYPKLPRIEDRDCFNY